MSRWGEGNFDEPKKGKRMRHRKIATEINNFDLHDSSIDSLKYDEDQRILILEIELSESYEGDPALKGWLTFYGVSNLTLTDCLKLVNTWNTFGFVSTADYVEEESTEDLDAMRWYFTIDNNSMIPTSCELFFLAESFSWSVK